MSPYPLLPASSWSPSSSSHSSRSPRVGNGKPMQTMNVLLTLGIILQIYQIYRTPTHSTQVEVREPSSRLLDDYPRGLRGTFGQPLPSFGKKKFVDAVVYDPGESQDIQLKRADSEISSQEQGSSRDYEFERRMPPGDRKPYFSGNEDATFQPFTSGGFNKTDNEVKAKADATDTSFRNSKYNYSLPAERTNWTLPTQPEPSSLSNLAVIVLSARANFERRQTIRETWAKEHSNVFFIIGGPEPENQADKNWSSFNSTSTLLLEEQGEYGDLLDTIHPDTYKGLPYKIHFAIRWICQHPGMEHIQWVLKVDDDVVARMNSLKHYVLSMFNPLTPMVIGRIEPNSKPHRNGKWAEDPIWVGIDGVDEYPPWAYGSTGYVMSRPVLDYVASETSLYYFQGEDVSLGIWLYRSPLDVSWIDSPEFTLESHLWAKNAHPAVIGHDLSVENMRTVYEYWKDPPVLSEPLHANHTNVKGRIYHIEATPFDYSTDDEIDHSWDSFEEVSQVPIDEE